MRIDEANGRCHRDRAVRVANNASSFSVKSISRFEKETSITARSIVEGTLIPAEMRRCDDSFERRKRDDNFAG